MTALPDKRCFRRALVIAGIVETVLFAIGIWSIYEGGMHPGGAVFGVLHLPSVLVFGYIFDFLEIGGSVADVILILMIAVAQFVLFTIAVYWAQLLFLFKK